MYVIYVYIFTPLRKKNNLHRSDRPHGGAQHSDPLVRPGLFFFLSANSETAFCDVHIHARGLQ